MTLRCSIIIPVLDECGAIEASLERLQMFRAAGAELIVVDGGSADDTVERAGKSCDRVLVSARGRARQMNAGAAAASGDVLIFLHADTTLPATAISAIADAIKQGARWGRFDVSIAGQSPAFPLIATLMNLRSRITGIATGDQAIFVTRDEWAAVGGFPDQSLMEDIELSTRLRRRSRPACLRERVNTSGRRWEKHGVLSTIVAMWRLRLLYFFGRDPEQLAIAYGYRPHTPSAIAIAILAKAPTPGQTKTRLIPALGATGAANLQRWLLGRTVTTAVASGVGPVSLWCTPSTDDPVFEQLARQNPLSLLTQPDGDLGTRMLAAISRHAEDVTVAGTLVIGTDCPALQPAMLARAAAVLRGDHDAVVIPAEDGGYVLIGMKRPHPEIFSRIDWGTPHVMQTTRERLQQIGWRWIELPVLWDVDRPADFERLKNTFPALPAMDKTPA